MSQKVNSRKSSKSKKKAKYDSLKYTPTSRTRRKKSVDSNELSYDSDSSLESVTVRTGNVPERWYKPYLHTGYDKTGERIEHNDPSKINKLLTDMKSSRHVYDRFNNKLVKLSDADCALIDKLMRGKTAKTLPQYHVSIGSKNLIGELFPAYQNNNKKSFIADRSMFNRVGKIARMIASGKYVTFDQKLKDWHEQKEKELYPSVDIWTEMGENHEQRFSQANNLPRLRAPKGPKPDHLESYNPPKECLPLSDEEVSSDDEDYELLKDRKVISNFRKVKDYDKFVDERYKRCLDLYLCPRMAFKPEKTEEELDKEMPDLPKPSTLKPYPIKERMNLKNKLKVVKMEQLGDVLFVLTYETLEIYHSTYGFFIDSLDVKQMYEFVRSEEEKADDDNLGQEIAQDFTISKNIVKMCYVCYGRYILVLDVSEYFCLNTVKHTKDSFGQILNRIKSQDIKNSKELLIPYYEKVEELPLAICKLILVIKNFRFRVRHVNLHKNDDYLLSTLDKNSVTKQILCIHSLKRTSSLFPLKKSGSVRYCAFIPDKPHLALLQKTRVIVYDIQQKNIVFNSKAIDTRFSYKLSISKFGDIMVWGKDNKISMFSADSQTPWKVLKTHNNEVRAVETASNKWNLMLTASEDAQVHLFHYSKFEDNEKLFVPLKILKHPSSVIHSVFDRKRPWIYTVTDDGVVRSWGL